MFKARPLGSTGITPLPRYYGPLRLPTWPSTGYLFPTNVEARTISTPGLPGSSVRLSERALPLHPGMPCSCSCSLLHCR